MPPCPDPAYWNVTLKLAELQQYLCCPGWEDVLSPSPRGSQLPRGLTLCLFCRYNRTPWQRQFRGYRACPSQFQVTVYPCGKSRPRDLKQQVILQPQSKATHSWRHSCAHLCFSILLKFRIPCPEYAVTLYVMVSWIINITDHWHVLWPT